MAAAGSPLWDKTRDYPVPDSVGSKMDSPQDTAECISQASGICESIFKKEQKMPRRGGEGKG